MYPKRSSPLRDFTLPTVLSVLCGGMVSLTILSRVLIDRLEEEEFYVRGLQVGVVAVDDQDRIVLGNDRAEEILHVELPGPGVPGEPIHQEWWKLLHPYVVVYGRDNEWAVRTIEHMKKMRARGESSTYIARLTTRKDEWIVVRGSPLLNEASHWSPRLFRDRDRATRPTFGVLSPIKPMAVEGSKLDFQVSNFPPVCLDTKGAGWCVSKPHDRR